MKHAPRSTHFWPKRWLRSFAGAALATAFVGGTVWSQDTPPAVPKEAPKAKAEAPAAKKERRITFAMADRPWSAVLDFYKNESGLAFNSVEKAPDGTFNYSPPTDPKTGQPKLYTLSEITDIINESLLVKNRILVRGETTFRLWPADQAIDPSLVRRVSLEELQTLAHRDMVQVVVDLKALVAANQVENVRKMMSKVGEVVAMTGGRNALIMIDQAGNLRRIIADLQASESTDGAVDAGQYSHKCVYKKAHEAASTLRDLIGAEGAPEPQVVPTPSTATPTRSFDRGGGGGGDWRDQFRRGGDWGGGGGWDPRGGGGGWDPRSGGSRGMQPALPTKVISDDSTNTVYVNGPADKVNQAKAFLVKFDVGTTPVEVGKADFQFYPVPAGTAETVAIALIERYKLTSIRVKAMGTNQIVAYAAPADQLDIIEFINKSTKAQKETAKTIEITGMDVDAAVTLLKAMFPLPSAGGPFIDKHPNGTGVIVRGRPEQVADVEGVVGPGLNAGGGTVGSPSATMRVIQMKDGSAVDLAEAIKGYLKAMGKGDVKVIGPGGSPVEPPVKEPPTPPKPKELPDVPKTGIEPKSVKLGLGVRDLAETSKLINAQLVEPGKKEAPKATEPGVTITAIGDRIIITGSDPQTVALAGDLARMITNNKGEVYKVFRLNNANASEAARVLSEWFNPPVQPQRNQNPFAAFFPGGNRGGNNRGGGNPFAPAAPAAADGEDPNKPRVRIVAEQSSNSLMVRANALDLITIERMLREVIDVGPGDSKAVVKPFFIEPLQYHVATEVVTYIQQVFSESTNRAASQGQGGQQGFGGGFGNPFGGFFGGGRNQQPLDSLGRPKQVTLTIAADDRTNSIMGTATAAMAEDIKTLVKTLEDKAKDSTKVVQLVPTKGIDPLLVQEVIDSIQGRVPQQPGTQQRGMGQGGSPFGQGGFGNFGQGGFGNQGRFGGGQGGFGTPGGGRFGNQGGGRFGGNQGGGRFGTGGGTRRRAPEPPPLPGDIGRGPDFFESRDMDVPQQTLLYDPFEESLKTKPVSAPVETLAPVKLAQAQEPVPVPPAPKKDGAAFDLISPRGPVTFNPLEEFGAGILTANNQQDLALVLKLIEELERYLRTQQADAGPKLKIIYLKNGDAVRLAALANQLGTRASGVIAATQPQIFGQQAGSAGGSVLLLPVPRSNAIMMFGPEIRFAYYEKLIADLDAADGQRDPGTAGLEIISLKRAKAEQVATFLTNNYAQRYATETGGNLIRITYDTSTNSISVQAGPEDMKEIKRYVEQIDALTSKATNELRVYQLRNAPAEDLANTVQAALMQNILPQGTGIPVIIQQQAGGFGGPGGFGQQQPGGQQPGAGGAFAQATGGVRTPVLGSATTNTTKTMSLRFLVPGKDGSFESGHLEDVHITPDVRSNQLLISAPKETLDLLQAVINSLDKPSAARALVNIFQLKKADATLTADLIRQLFSGGNQQQGGQPGGPGGQFGQNLQQTTGGTGAFRPLLTTTGSLSDGAGLLNIGVVPDARTNSIVVTAGQSDLDAIRAIVARLEDAETQNRVTQVIKLRNASAVDVANALTPFLTQSLTVIQTGLTQTNFLEQSRNIIISPEPVTNNLLVSATPAALQTLIPVIERLDAQPLQVSIQCIIAEVTLTNNEEFGVEIGLQSPVLFNRTVVPTGDAGFGLANVAGGVIPPGVTLNSTSPIYSGSAFNFNSVAAGIQNAQTQPYKQGVVGLQGLTNYGVGRSNANGVGGFVFSAGSDTVNVLIRALKTQGRVDNFTTPNITVLDNQIGSVNVGGLFPYVAGGTFTQFGTFQPNILQQQIGTTLTVTPRISPEGRILMRVEPSIIAPVDTLVALGNGQFATSFSQQSIQTTVSVMDGETIVLGGLITKSNQRNENKVPWLGDLPYVGSLFRFRTQQQAKSELLVIMTPHVIRNCVDSERLLMAEARKMSWVLRDVDRMSRSAQPLPSNLENGPDGGMPILPPGAYVQPDGGSPLPIGGDPASPTLPPPVTRPLPPATAPIMPMPPATNIPPSPQTPPGSTFPPPPPPVTPVPMPPKGGDVPVPLPEPPKVSTLPEAIPASGILLPGERK